MENKIAKCHAISCQSGGPFAGMLVKSTVSVEKDMAEIDTCFTLEIEKTRVIVKNGAIV